MHPAALETTAAQSKQVDSLAHSFHPPVHAQRHRHCREPHANGEQGLICIYCSERRRAKSPQRPSLQRTRAKRGKRFRRCTSLYNSKTLHSMAVHVMQQERRHLLTCTRLWCLWMDRRDEQLKHKGVGTTHKRNLHGTRYERGKG